MFGEVATPIDDRRDAELRRQLAKHAQPGKRCRCRRCASNRSELICADRPAYRPREVNTMDLSAIRTAPETDAPETDLDADVSE